MFRVQRVVQRGGSSTVPFLTVRPSGTVAPNKAFMELINTGKIRKSIHMLDNHPYTPQGDKNPYYDESKPKGVYLASEQEEQPDGFIFSKPTPLQAGHRLMEMFKKHEPQTRDQSVRWVVKLDQRFVLEDIGDVYLLTPEVYNPEKENIKAPKLDFQPLGIKGRAIANQDEFDAVKAYVDRYTRYGDQGGTMTFKALAKKIDCSPGVVAAVTKPERYKQFRGAINA